MTESSINGYPNEKTSQHVASSFYCVVQKSFIRVKVHSTIYQGCFTVFESSTCTKEA